MTLAITPEWLIAQVVVVLGLVLASPVIAARTGRRAAENVDKARSEQLDAIQAAAAAIDAKATTAVLHVANSHYSNLRDDVDDLRGNVDELGVDMTGMAITLRSIDEHLRLLASQDRATGERITQADQRLTQAIGRLNDLDGRLRHLEQPPGA